MQRGGVAMSDPKLESVFKISGVPTYTFVQPSEYNKLLVALRTAGRGVIVEGPSGIGKTSAVETALKDLGLPRVTKLSARKKADVEYIEILPTLSNVGLVIVDDFHRLPDATKRALADCLKTLADEEREDVKIVIVGINRAGERLIGFAADLVNRVDVIQFESNPEHKVAELLQKGQGALNVSINVVEDIVASAQGSFYIAQLLAHEVCLKGGVTERQNLPAKVEVSFEGVRASVWDRLKMTFYEPCRRFCQGSKMKAAGRAPYLHILHALAEGQDWSLSLMDIRKFGVLRGSVGQVVEKGFLADLIKNDADIRRILHYDAKILTIEDPQLAFFIKHIPWAEFAREIGFVEVTFEKRYDFALSFSGSDRDVADALFHALDDEEVAVFYDKNEQHRILAENVEEYLRPIYQSEATLVVCLLGPEYPKRIWTKIESDAFKERFKNGEVIPIWFSNAPTGMFDEPCSGWAGLRPPR
jgi:hypothetical protein